MPLTDSHKRKLKQQAHHLKPVVLLGANGLTENVHKEIDRALTAHELIKIKLSSKDKTEKELLAHEICDLHEATLVAHIGHVITIYKPRE